ncbi:antibiotic biosynthesis monooxygenase family protein [Burkholderia gladioli]|uniref:antibiotic biosynthesis monooxygenase family protein n=1 Tax=Burkholderia gladioli TaxID=28095 RepID=UPI001640325B|nr:antibiotic biosynthesis monooxygenase [Burkholderia gladioli]
MILEIATFRIVPESNQAFEAAFSSAQQFLTVTPGYLDHKLQRGIEDPAQYWLLVNWNSVEDHLQGFRGSPRFAQWRALLQPFFVEAPKVVHCEPVPLQT